VNTGARRRSLWLAMLLTVMWGHAGVLAWLAHNLVGWGDAASPSLARMDVAFVKELAPAAPAAPAPMAVAKAAARPPARAPREPATKPTTRVPEPAASAPEPAASQSAVEVVAAAIPASAVNSAESAASAASEASQAVALATPTEASPAVFASASASQATADTFDWPPSTRLTYTLLGNYRGEVHGHARVQWVRRGGRYQVHLDVFIGPSFAPLMSRRMTSDGTLGVEGLTPQRYEEVTKLPFQTARQVAMRFEPGQVTLANGQIRDALPGLQDTASQFVQLAWFFTQQPQQLRVGNTVPVPLALPRRIDQWVYEVVGQEQLQTPVGLIDTYHLRPRRAELRPKGELSAEIWFAPTLQYLPVRIRMQQDADTYADLLLDAAPLQAEPGPAR
jgi:hypothetical protein